MGNTNYSRKDIQSVAEDHDSWILSAEELSCWLIDIDIDRDIELNDNRFIYLSNFLNS